MSIQKMFVVLSSVRVKGMVGKVHNKLLIWDDDLEKH